MLQPNCSYCLYYQLSKSIKFINNKQFKFCDQICDHIYKTHQICDKFVVNKYFWCNRKEGDVNRKSIKIVNI